MKTNPKVGCFKAVILSIVILTIPFTSKLSAQEKDSTMYRHTIQLNALELLGHLYSVVYSYQFSPQNHLMLGLAYQNFRYDFGTVHAPTVIVGYKRYLWKGLHAEAQLWPAYNSFYEKNENKYYKGFEVWSEARLAYDFTFKIKGLSMFIAPQLITGTAIVEGNKPKSFLDYYKTQRFAVNIAYGIHF